VDDDIFDHLFLRSRIRSGSQWRDAGIFLVGRWRHILDNAGRDCSDRGDVMIVFFRLFFWTLLGWIVMATCFSFVFMTLWNLSVVPVFRDAVVLPYVQFWQGVVIGTVTSFLRSGEFSPRDPEQVVNNGINAVYALGLAFILALIIFFLGYR
jgi:hypothetical protein